MAVAKRQRRKKPAKIEQRKIPGPEWEPQMKHAALLASPVYRGQAQGEEAKMDWGSSFGLACPHASRMYFSFARQIKLSCNWAVTLVCCFKFSLWRDRTKELTHCPNKRIKNIYFTFSIIFLVYFNWRLITLQYCSCFCHTLTWICHECTCVPHPEPPSHLPPHPIPQGCPSAPALSALFHASNLDWWSISHMVIYMKHLFFMCKLFMHMWGCQLVEERRTQEGKGGVKRREKSS